MKKSLIVLIILFFCIISGIIVLYSNFTSKQKELQNYNVQFEEMYMKNVYGTDVATFINKVIDLNETNGISKNDKGAYIDDGIDSVKIDIKFLDSDDIYNMETIYKLGVNEFIYNFNLMTFRLTKIEYHKASGKVSYLLFEQAE